MHDDQDWQLSDQRDFRFGVDQNLRYRENEVVFLKSVAARPKDVGFICKSISPDPYICKKLRMFAWLKTDLPEGASAQLWLRVDGKWKRRTACFDNMFLRRIKGRTDWQRSGVSVEVPAGSQTIVYGVLLDGTGQLWLSNVEFEVSEQQA